MADDDKRITVRLDRSLWQKLRKIAFRRDRPLNDLFVEGACMVIAANKAKPEAKDQVTT
jgi:hypothetical protein